MDLEKEIKKLKSRGPENPLPAEKMARILAAGLDQAAAQAAFKFFRDKKFRQETDFNGLSQIEQDRIFNELVLAAIVLIMLTLEAPDLRCPDEMREFLLLVKERLPKEHLDYLKNLGVERKYLSDWERLIAMRYEEYHHDKGEARAAAIEIESAEQELTAEGLTGIQLVLPVQVVAIGAHHHILRGKTRGKDELFKLILRWLSRFYIEIRVPMEGGKITFWKRLMVNFRHLKEKVAKILTGKSD